MPETLAPAIEERVRALVDEHQTELQQLVQLEVDRLLRELVGQELAARNGAQRTSLRSNGARETLHRAEQRRCRHCGETKPLSEFGQHRHVCHDCRRQQQARARERRAQPAQEGDSPRPSPDGA